MMIAFITTWVLATWPALERWRWFALGLVLPELGRREARRAPDACPSADPSALNLVDSAVWPFVFSAQLSSALPGLRVISLDRLGPGIPGSHEGCIVVDVCVLERGRPGTRRLTRQEWGRAIAAGVPLLAYDAASQLRALRGLAGGAS